MFWMARRDEAVLVLNCAAQGKVLGRAAGTGSGFWKRGVGGI